MIRQVLGWYHRLLFISFWQNQNWMTERDVKWALKIKIFSLWNGFFMISFNVFDFQWTFRENWRVKYLITDCYSFLMVLWVIQKFFWRFGLQLKLFEALWKHWKAFRLLITGLCCGIYGFAGILFDFKW